MTCVSPETSFRRNHLQLFRHRGLIQYNRHVLDSQLVKAYISPEVATCLLACREGSNISRSRKTLAKLWKDRKKRRLSDSLIVINVVVYFLDILFKRELAIWGIHENSLILAGQWWRPFTSTVLHLNWLHLGVIFFDVCAIVTICSAHDIFAHWTESFSKPYEQMLSRCHVHNWF